MRFVDSGRILFVTLTLGFSLTCFSQSFPGSNFGPIPNGVSKASPESYGPPRDIFFTAGQMRTVSEVSVTFTASHTWVGDLRVTLIAPNGNRHLLFARTGATTPAADGFGSDLNGTYTFSDAPGNQNWWTGAATSPVPSGSYRTVIAGGQGVSNPAPVTSMNSHFSRPRRLVAGSFDSRTASARSRTRAASPMPR
jgi:hypothetical protein